MAFKPDDFRKSLLAGSLKRDLRSRKAADKSQRDIANREYVRDENNKKIPVPRFLRSEDLVTGHYDVERALKTTLGLKDGDLPRAITLDDIIAFQENIKLLRDQYTKGITPRNIINLSNIHDIERANEQITMVVPVSRVAGLVHFITNSSKESNVINHHVEVEFVNFDSVVSDIHKQTASTIKNRLATGNIRFECDCGRHTYWYRYMATIGGYGLGRKEHGFPKIRNPNLMGVACKHVLKVMQYIMSVSGQLYLKNAVDKDRTKQHGKLSTTTKKQIESYLDRQELAKEQGKKRTIEPNMEHAEREMLRRDRVARQHEQQTAMNKSARAEAAKRKDKEVDPKKIKARAELTAAYKSGILSKETYEQSLKAHK